MNHVARRLVAIAAALLVVGTLLGACTATGGLTANPWQLTALTTTAPAFQGVVPAADQSRYTITFANDGTASIKADCNQVTATYTSTAGGGLTVVPGASTMAMCPEDSMGTQFVEALALVDSYSINGTQLMMKGDEGTLEFAPAK